VLKGQPTERPQDAFVQLSVVKNLKFIPDDAKKVIDSFVSEDQQSQETLEANAPSAAGYSVASKGIMKMLAELLDKFVMERTRLEQEETKTKNAYELLMQDLTSQIDEATEDRDEKAERKARKLQAKAAAVGDLEDTSTTKQADTTYLEDLVATCEEKATNFEARQQLRAEEIEAVKKAMEIISSKAVSGSAEKHLPAFLQVKTPALVQFGVQVQDSTRARLTSFLQSQALKLDSAMLSAMALRAAADPFKKVQKMIGDLITRLLEQANEEAEHKQWCDSELATNEQTRAEKTKAVETLTSEIDQLQASIAKLTEQIGKLTTAVAELDAAVAEATELRQKEKAKNSETVSDAEEAQTAVAQALTVLKEFYAKAGEATSLMQQQPEAPEIFDEPYKGMQSENGGVMGMLEVIQADFARLESETKAAEASAVKEYETFMSDSKVDKTSKSKDIEHKSSKKQDEEEALVVKKEDLEGTEKEMDAALQYYDKLKPDCVDAGDSYEDRVARRKEEIESLQDALRILNGEDMA